HIPCSSVYPYIENVPMYLVSSALILVRPLCMFVQTFPAGCYPITLRRTLKFLQTPSHLQPDGPNDGQDPKKHCRVFDTVPLNPLSIMSVNPYLLNGLPEQ